MKIPGPNSKALREKEDRYLAPGLQHLALMAGIVLESGQGCWVTDVDGNRFLDIVGGIGVNGLGHSHPRFVKAITEQVARLSIGSFSSRARINFLERLAKYHPEPGEYRIQLYSGGSEAVESALRLAKSYTGKYEFVSFWGGFHGKTLGSLSLMGSTYKHGVGPMASGNHIVPYARCYRCPLQKQITNCDMACADLAEEQLRMSSAGEVAAVIVEPIQGTAGNVIPPKEWLVRIRKLCDKLGALLICDEMITGFGRTGKFWGWEHSGVKPDIITMGKQFGGGYPLSAVLARKEIVQAKPWSSHSGSSSSYGANPLASAAADATLKTIEEEGLVEKSREKGEYFLSKLKDFETRFPFVGEVRGVGLLLGIDMVLDKESKEPLPREITEEIFNLCLKRGLLTMAYAPSFRIQTPMTIQNEEIDQAVAILEEVFGVVSEKYF